MQLIPRILFLSSDVTMYSLLLMQGDVGSGSRFQGPGQDLDVFLE